MARNDNYEFLSDVVPPMVPYKEAKVRKAKVSAGIDDGEEQGGAAKGKKQMKLGKGFEVVIEQKNGANGDKNGEMNGNGKGEEESDDADPEQQLRSEQRKERISLSGSGILNGESEEDKDGDVQMR